MPQAEQYWFGSFHLEVSERELRRNSEVIALTPKTFDLLLILVQGAGRTFTKAELLESLWPGRIVEESNLSQTIFQLRKALNESGGGSEFILTVPRRGYKFVGSVSRHNTADNHSGPQELPETPPSETTIVAGDLSPAESVSSPVNTRGRWRLPIGAFVALAAVCVAGGFAWQRMRINPVTDQDVLVLADFTNATGDPVFDGTLREALAIRLEESPFLKVMSDEEVRQALRLMGRSPAEHISNDIARQVCIREGDKAMISGAITQLGKTYAITLQAYTCQSGQVLARAQVEAADKDHVLQALATAGRKIRLKLGESVGSIPKLDDEFEARRVSTPSLEAFQAFTLGRAQARQGYFREAITSLQRAIELDPNFAAAYGLVGVMYFNLRDYELRDQYWTKAFSLIDRVSSERERLRISLNYYAVTGQSDKNEEIAQLIVHTYPRDGGTHNLLGNIYFGAGEFEKALQESREVLRLSHMPSAVPYGNLIYAYTLLGRYEEAKAAAQGTPSETLDAPYIHERLLALAYTEGDREAAVKETQWFAGKPGESASFALQAQNAYALGQRRKAKELYRRARELLQRGNLASAAARALVTDAAYDAVLGNCEAIRAAAEITAFPYQNRDFSEPAALGLAVCGQVQAQKIADKISKRFPVDILWNAGRLPAILAALELERNNPVKAIELLQSAVHYERAYPSVMYLRGLAYLKANEGDKAGVEFRKILDHKGAYWILLAGAPYYSLSYLGLARAEALSGDVAASRKAYQDLFALWKAADPDLAILAQAQKEYAALR